MCPARSLARYVNVRQSGARVARCVRSSRRGTPRRVRRGRAPRAGRRSGGDRLTLARGWARGPLSARDCVIGRPSKCKGLYGASVRLVSGVSGSKLAVRGRRVRIRGRRTGRRVGRRLGVVRRSCLKARRAISACVKPSSRSERIEASRASKS